VGQNLADNYSATNLQRFSTKLFESLNHIKGFAAQLSMNLDKVGLDEVADVQACHESVRMI
jgi:hypothetical protein